MSDLRVTVESDGQIWEGIENLSIGQSLDTAYHTLRIQTTDRVGDSVPRWNINGGSLVNVYFNGTLAFSGYIVTENSERPEGVPDLTISGKSPAVDLVESCHVGRSFWKNTTSDRIIAEVLDPFVQINPYIIEDGLEPIDAKGFKVSPTDTAFSIIKKLAERSGMVAFTDYLGRFSVTKPDTDFTLAELAVGDFTEFQRVADRSKSYSSVTVLGQRNTRSKDFTANQQTKFTINNPAEPRYRPLVITASGDDSAQEQLTDYYNRRLIGQTLRASATMKSPFDRNGILWGIGRRVLVNVPSQGINNRELLITESTMSLTRSSGFECSISLRLPESYGLPPASRRALRRASGIFGTEAEALAI